ncbi:lytic polysaccharide monooxygenase [Paraglaciecola sp.]|uniref:lytic polysaccharide monooxygenase n=1 Tax=Paraglaciecola sp. TaxID=1920173 RepID=UPI0030F46CEA
MLKLSILPKNTAVLLSAVALISCVSTSLFGHGLMQSPASRNQFCGVLTKPDQAMNGTGLYPICADAFADDFTRGYNFMSVLTHAQGRKVVTPLPSNVCGFDAETWQGEATPWDKAIDWPTNNMQSGNNEIVWNISWGPHFDDTKEFVYWITKANFEYQVGVPLTWDDFEAAPFCDLQYSDSSPDANPNVRPDKDNTLFRTYCDVPDRQGRHVIYGEWGRNHFTYERFHGCVDAQFGDSNDTNVIANFSLSPDVSSVTGAGSFSLDASGSVGDNLSYQWSVSGGDNSLYAFTDTTSATTQLSYAEPSEASTVSVVLTVSDGISSDSEVVSFEHLPSAVSATWLLNSSLTASRTLNTGDSVTLRVVDNSGTDTYLPSSPLQIDSANSAADIWPYQLAQLIGTAGDVTIGILATDGTVTPVVDATANNIYTRIGANIAGAFLNIDTASTSSSCEFIVANEWDNGYVANIRITNNSSAAISGWQVSWSLQDSQINNLWNANYVAGTTNTASNLSWNSNIQPGQYVEFGFVANKNITHSSVSIPVVSGAVCN